MNILARAIGFFLLIFAGGMAVYAAFSHPPGASTVQDVPEDERQLMNVEPFE